MKKQKSHLSLIAKQALGMPLLNKFSRFSKRRKSSFHEVRVLSENCLLDPRYSLKSSSLNLGNKDNLTMSNDELSSSRKPKSGYKKKLLHQVLSDNSSMASSIHLRPLTTQVEREKLDETTMEQTPDSTYESRLQYLECKVQALTEHNEQKLNQIYNLLIEIKQKQDDDSKAGYTVATPDYSKPGDDPSTKECEFYLDLSEDDMDDDEETPCMQETTAWDPSYLVHDVRKTLYER